MSLDSADVSLAAEWLQEADHVVVFSGAGASAESGIPTFRDEAGFWQEFPPEHFATWSGLAKTAAGQPRRLAEFLLAVVDPIARAEPNAGHVAIAVIERHCKTTVITQNIDRLHQEAGSTLVHEVHGSLFEIVDDAGNHVRTLTRDTLRAIAEQLKEAATGRLALPGVATAIAPLIGVGIGGAGHPQIVLFGDAMAEPAWGNAMGAATSCDVMICVGTSCSVMPAAMLPEVARREGARVIEVDPRGGMGDMVLQGKAGEVLPPLVERAFGK